MMKTKHELMTEWLDANPGKTERDWLIDVRCPVNRGAQLREVLDLCDKANIEYEIPGEVHLIIPEYDRDADKNVYAAYNNSLRRDMLKLKEYGIESIFFDIIFNKRYPYDMDYPEELFDSSAKFYVVSMNISDWKALQTMPEEKWESEENRWSWLSGSRVGTLPLVITPNPIPWYADYFIQYIN